MNRPESAPLITRVENRLPEVVLALFVACLVPGIHLFVAHLIELLGKLRGEPAGFWRILRSDPWPVIMGTVSLAAGVFLAVRLWSHWQTVWAVARLMILEAFHRKVVFALLLFFILLMPSLPFILKSEGTLKSHVQIILTYSLAMGKYLLCFIAIFLSTASLSEEIEFKQIHNTDVKPVPRWSYLAGKWFGIMALNTVLLFTMAFAVYGLVAWISRERTYPYLTERENKQKEFHRRQVFEEVLVTRREFKRAIPDVVPIAKEELNRVKKEKAMPEGFTDKVFMDQLVPALEKRSQTAPPLSRIGWQFSGLKPPSADPEKAKDEVVFIRFRLEIATAQGGSDTVMGTWIVGDPDTNNFFVRSGRWAVRSDQEIWAPASAVKPDGTLIVIYQNEQPDVSIVFPVDKGLEILQKSGPFWPNLYRALFIIGCYVAVLAAIGTMSGALFSFPVAVLVASFVFVMGLISPWFDTMIKEGGITIIQATPAIPGQARSFGAVLAQGINKTVEALLKGVFAILPGFSLYNPVGELVTGHAIRYALVARAAFWFLVIRGGLIALLAAWLFHRKELARVQV